MKITKRQLRRIIREAFDYNDAEYANEMAQADYAAGMLDGKSGRPMLKGANDDYAAGYEDGLAALRAAGITVAEREYLREATIRRMGTMKITKRQLKRIIREAINEMHPGDWDKPGVEKDPQRPWGTYAEKNDESYYDVIMMSPNGDSLLVDGRETYLQDVPSQLQHASGIEMSDVDADNLIFALETQEQDGYVELGVEYKDGKWSW